MPTLVATVTPAAAQPTVIGREIHRLAIFDGHLYPAFGDYSANTGPIDVVSIDLAAQTLGTSEVTLHTDETWAMRRASGALLVPYVDPQGTNANPENGQYAVASAHGAWSVVMSMAGATHVMDMAETVDGLWACGSNESTPKAVIWRSTDNGATWTESLTHTDGAAGADGLRFYAFAQFGDTLLALGQATDPIAYRWEGASWTVITPYSDIGTSAGITDTIGPFDHPSGTFWIGILNDKLVQYAASSRVVVLPGSGADAAAITAPISFAGIFDAAVAGGFLWLLSPDLHVHRGDTTGAWTDLLVLDDPTVRSIAADTADGWLYFGTTDSRILRTPIPAWPDDRPPPSGGGSFVISAPYSPTWTTRTPRSARSASPTSCATPPTPIRPRSRGATAAWRSFSGGSIPASTGRWR